MAAQPCLSAADVESLLEPIKTAAAQLNTMVGEGQSILERTTVFMNEVQTYLEQRDSARQQRRHDDKNMTPLHHGLAEHEKILRLAGLGLAAQNQGLHPPLQHQRNNLDPLEFGPSAHPYHNPLIHGVANEQPIFSGCGRRLNRGSTPYDAADEQKVSDQREHRPNRSPLPYSTPDDRFISDDERRGHAHGHRLGHDPLPLISDFNPVCFLDTYYDLRGPYSRRGLYRGLDIGRYDVKSLGPQPTRGLQARLDNIYDTDLAMPPRPHHRNLEKANVRAPWHHSTDYPFPDGPKDHRIGEDLCKAQARQTLEPRSTGYLAPLTFTGIPRETAAEIDHWSSLVRKHNESDADKRRLEQMRAQLRQQGEQHAARYGKFKRKASDIARPPRPAPNLFNDDFEQLPHHCHDVPFRPHKKGTIHVCTARKDGFDYPTLPVHLVQQVDDLNRPRVVAAMSKTLANAVIEDTFHDQKQAQGPVVDAKRSNIAHNNSGVGAFTDPSNNDENPNVPSDPSSDSSESSESGYDTPDFDESSGAGDEDKDDAEGLGWVGM